MVYWCPGREKPSCRPAAWVSENGGACTLTLGTIHCLFQIIDRGQATLSRISSGAHSAGECSRGDTFLLFPANFGTVPSAQNRAILKVQSNPMNHFSGCKANPAERGRSLLRTLSTSSSFLLCHACGVFSSFFANYLDSQQLT